MKIFPDKLDELPVGAGFTSKNERVTLTVINQGENGFEVVAECDSLDVLVTDLTTRIYHLDSDNSSLREQLKEHTTEIIHEPTGWQWFQIWTGRILSAITGLWIFWKIYFRKK